MLTEQQGADTLVWLATDHEAGLSSGGYWENRQTRPPSPVVGDAQLIDRFWDESEKLVRKVIPEFDFG